MNMIYDGSNPENNNKQFGEKLKTVIGDSIRKPVTVALGWTNEDGIQFIQVPETDTDQPNKFYFHELYGQPQVGQAFFFEGTIHPDFLRYNLPIRIKKDVLSADWVIVGVDPQLAAEFLATIVPTTATPINLENFIPGLLTETVPQSMKARVMGSAYSYDSTWHYIDTQNTVDWSTSPYNTNIPVSNNVARYVLVQVNYATGALNYKVAPTEVPSALLPRQIALLDSGSGTLMPQTDTGYFRSGYIKLIKDMTVITSADNLWALQEILFKTETSSLTGNIIDSIVVQDNEVVCQDGNVVWQNP